MNVMNAKTAMAMVVLGAVTVPQLLQAQSPACAPRDTVLRKLADTYGETRQSIGLNGNNALVEVFASDETGSWTITVTRPDGTTCLVAAGNAFERIDEIRPTGDPA